MGFDYFYGRGTETTLYKIEQRLKEKIDCGKTGVNAGKGFYTY